MPTGTETLLEREGELDAISRSLDRVDAGSGKLLSIAGPAGIGKSALVDVAGTLAAGQGWTVFASRGGELERGTPFGIVRQLFERRLAGAGASERARLLAGSARHAERALAAPAADGDGHEDALLATFHGLYWLCANLADDRPVLLSVDDAQWADAESLRWIAYMTRRIADVRVLLLTATRVPEPPELAAALAAGADSEGLRPSELSRAAAESIVYASRGEGASPEFCDACFAASGGNPFYLRELVVETAAQEIEATASGAAQVRGLSPHSIAASVLLRLRQLGDPAIGLARAVAVLGINADVRDAGVLASLDVQTAQSTADELATAGILLPRRPLEFAHPVIRASVYADLAPGLRANLHLAAARLEHDHQPFGEIAATHLVLVDPAGESWAAEALHAAAQRAFARGALPTARRLAARALAEPPGPDSRAAVVRLLARAELHAGRAVSVAHLREALVLSTDPRDRIELLLELIDVVESSEASALLEGDPTTPADWMRLLRDALRPVDPQLSEPLDALLPLADRDAGAEAAIAETRRRLRPLVDSTPWFRGWAHGMLALMGCFQGDEPVATVERHARGALDLSGDHAEWRPWRIGAEVLQSCDSFGPAGAAIEAAFAGVAARGSERGFVFASLFQAEQSIKLGDLEQAVAAARSALDVTANWDEPNVFITMVTCTLVHALIDRGELREAEQALRQAEAAAPERRPDAPPDRQLIYARALLRSANGEAAGADDLLRVGEDVTASGILNPAAWDWRAEAVHALLASGRREEALELAADNLTRANRFGAPGAIGRALRAMGQAEQGADGTRLLEDAVATLEKTPRRLDTARALVDLGVALRHAKARTRSRETLRAGLEFAERCGAAPLAARAREELKVAGARPRRQALSGVDALTASELRVARLASQGLTNREVAQSLFVSMRTVAFHLSNTYRKLDVTSREELVNVLSADP